MTSDISIALIGFALASSCTPGPNNLMLMASGMNFGLSRTVPHILGVVVGYPAMIFLVGLGVMQVFDLWPLSYTILRVLSVIYLLYLAWKIANAAPPAEATTGGKPLTFLQSAAFQWVNPKGWSMGLSAITLYAVERDFASVLWVSCVFVGAAALSTTSWTILGRQLRQLIGNDARLRMFNRLMALLLVATLVPVLWTGQG